MKATFIWIMENGRERRDVTRNSTVEAHEEIQHLEKAGIDFRIEWTPGN